MTALNFYKVLTNTYKLSNVTIDNVNYQVFKGSATVKVQEINDPSADVKNIIFYEKGQWHSPIKIEFSNIYYWQINIKTDTLNLSHGRFGLDNLTHLLSFYYSTEKQIWTSDTPHLCHKDQYFGRIQVDHRAPWQLRWQIIGPNKNSVIDIDYTSI